MPLYNNVITNMNREDTPDEDKLGYEFWNAVEELPIIKQIKDYNETTARQSEYLAERARSGQSGLLSQGLQAVSDTLGTVVGLPFQALETGIQATSDRTNIDARTLGAVKDIIGYSKAVKVPKSGKFYKGVQTAKKNIPRADILNPGQITVKPKQVVDEVFSLSRTKKPQIPMVTTGHKDLVLSAEQLGLQGVPGFTGQPYALESKRKRDQSPKEYSNEFFNQKFDEMGLTDDVKFSLKHMLDSKHMTEYVRRTRKMGIGNPDYSLDDYKKTRQVLVTEFLDGLEAFDIEPSEIEAHHIASLRQVAQLFEGLERHEFPDMIKLIYKHGIFTGNDPDNLVAIPKIGHITDKKYPNIAAVHSYLNKELGLYNENIAGDWGVLVRDLTVEEREDFVKRFAAVVRGSQPVYEQAIRDALDAYALRQPGVEGDNPFDDMTYGEQAAYDAGRDISEADAEIAKEKIAEYFKLQLTEPNYEALLDSIFGGDSAGEAMRRRGIKPGQPIQGQLLDLGRKPPRKTTKKDNEYPSGPGAYWDIESE